MGGFLLGGTDPGDPCTFLPYEKMFESALFVKTTRYSLLDWPRQLLL
jgi:hypothetical protein